MHTINHRRKAIKIGNTTRRMTGKQAAFVQAKIDNPKMTNTDAVIKAGYNVKSRTVANALGTQLMEMPVVQMNLAEHNDLLESAIMGTVEDWKDSNTPRKREIALNAAMFAYDHVHGKATTKIETKSTIVKISIDLTGSGEEPPPEEEMLDLEVLDNIVPDISEDS